jgi:hypothetical protein
MAWRTLKKIRAMWKVRRLLEHTKKALPEKTVKIGQILEVSWPAPLKIEKM